MDRERVSAITHGDLPFHNPLDPARIDEAIGWLGLGPGDRVLDLGCGPGELLVRLAERTGCGGIGLDTSGLLIAEARRRAAERVPHSELVFRAGDAARLDPAQRGFAAACCLGSSHALGGLSSALEELTARLRPGGAVLLGDGYWARPPDPAYLEALGGASEDELPSLSGLLESGRAMGLEAVWVATSSARDWESYKWALIANGDRLAREHPDDPLAAGVLAWIGRARQRLLAPGGTATMGFALVVLRGRPG